MSSTHKRYSNVDDEALTKLLLSYISSSYSNYSGIVFVNKGVNGSELTFVTADSTITYQDIGWAKSDDIPYLPFGEKVDAYSVGIILDYGIVNSQWPDLLRISTPDDLTTKFATLFESVKTYLQDKIKEIESNPFRPKFSKTYYLAIGRNYAGPGELDASRVSEVRVVQYKVDKCQAIKHSLWDGDWCISDGLFTYRRLCDGKVYQDGNSDNLIKTLLEESTGGKFISEEVAETLGFLSEEGELEVNLESWINAMVSNARTAQDVINYEYMYDQG